MLAVAMPASALTARLPDGRSVEPVGFTIPVGDFASAMVPSPDGKLLAVLCQGTKGAASVDVVDRKRSLVVARLDVVDASALAWTTDGLYAARGYSGVVSRFTLAGTAAKPAFAPRADLPIDASGLIDGLVEDPQTHTLYAARTAAREVVAVDDRTGTILARRPAAGQPFALALVDTRLVASLFDGDGVEVWSRTDDAAPGTVIATGPHPTQLLVANDRVFVANADGHDVVAIDPVAETVVQRYELGRGANPPPGQTPAGMAIDGDRLFVAESGYNDVAVVDIASRRVLGRIPTAWYPTAVVAERVTQAKDARPRVALWVANAKGMGSQADPLGEWDGTYTGIVQHLAVNDANLARFTATVVRASRFSPAPSRFPVPRIAHVVLVVRENKHYDEEFGDLAYTNADPTLVLYGRRFTPNAHALADRYAVSDAFMTDGEASIYGHAWMTQSLANDYHERSARENQDVKAPAYLPYSIWPYALAGENLVDAKTMDFDWFTDLAKLPGAPRTNVAPIFLPRGELIDEAARKHVSFRVYGEQMTMLHDGSIAPELPSHADTEYPGAHIDFGVLDTDRAALFLKDVAAHGLARYSYLTLPDDHTAGTRPGTYTPASFVANNDLALGRIVEGLSKRPDWASTVVFVTCDDAQGTGDHVDSHRMPFLAIGPSVKRRFVSHAPASQAGLLKTVEVLLGLDPLTIEDAQAEPMLDLFATQRSVSAFTAVAESVPLEMNPGRAAFTGSMDLDGPDSVAIPSQEWASIKGSRSLARHESYLRSMGFPEALVAAER
jgi:YVTN family beta-propeller protein